VITERKELSDQDVLQVFDFAVKNDRKIWWIENMDMNKNTIDWDIP
jgi:hypothetical protein